ncbi:hypothetical protein [Flavobacterium sp. FlaQc-50]|uniref:hypothetical protein n=1 Tax=unclassified Flavobacterium TaxID=196869 RepID=UPI0037568706
MSNPQLLKEVQTLQSNFKSGVVSINEAVARLSALATESGQLFSDLYNAFDSAEPALIINMV